MKKKGWDQNSLMVEEGDKFEKWKWVWMKNINVDERDECEKIYIEK